MNWWDKILGTKMSTMHGRHLGAMFSAAIEHIESLGREYLGREDTALAQQAFFTATFTVLGYLARNHPRGADVETDITGQIMERMQLDGTRQQAALDLFVRGQQPEFSLQEVLGNFRDTCRHRRNLLHMFLEIQITSVVVHQGEMVAPEYEELRYIGKSLGFSIFDIDYLIELVQAQQFYAQGGRGEYAISSFKVPTPLSGSYEVLGVAEYATDREVTAAYRRLMNQHHPDKLEALGVSETEMREATEKTREIKVAYDEIMRDRAVDKDTDRSEFN